MSALALLTISDLLCGLSQNATMLYVFRGLAGVANGGITSLAMMIVSDVVTLKERGKYQGVLGACVGLGNMVGPFAAAAFVQHSTWRGLFWVISPLAAVCGVICFFTLPKPKLTSKPDYRALCRKIDYWGILTASAGIVLILIPVSGGGSYFAWDSAMIISMLVVGGCCLLTFLFVEYRVALLPMMPCGLPSTSLSNLANINDQCHFLPQFLYASCSSKTSFSALYTIPSSTTSPCITKTHDACRRFFQQPWSSPFLAHR